MRSANDPWHWLSEPLMLLVHEEQLAEHGGPPGVRDAGLLSAALARPQHRAMYGQPDAAELAACYAFGIARNHPFVDGNKRAAFVAMELFLDINGFELVASDADCVLWMIDMSAGVIDESALAQWLRDHVVAASG